MTVALARRELGRTGLEVSVLGFGGAGIGNLYRELADEDALAAVRESFASGVRYFDTAPFYGFGLSELRLGAALAGGNLGLYALMATSFFMSIQFPTIFTMSLRGLGAYTNSGSSFLVMAIVGGAVIPPVM